MLARLPVALLFWCLGVGIGGSLIYEGYAWMTGRAPTISRITGDVIAIHPNLAVVFAFFFGGMFLLLVEHFSGALPWWKP